MKRIKDFILNMVVTLNIAFVGWCVVSYFDVVINRPDITNWNCFSIFF